MLANRIIVISKESLFVSHKMDWFQIQRAVIKGQHIAHCLMGKLNYIKTISKLKGCLFAPQHF